MQDLTTFLSAHYVLTSSIAALFVLLVIVELMRAKRATSALTVAKATQFINHDNAVVIDLRTKEQFKQGHIIDAQSIPSRDFASSKNKLEKYRARPIILVCASGLESQKLAAILVKEGYNIYSLSGGMRAWTDAQMPLIKE